MLLLDLTEDGIVVTDVESVLSPEHKSMLAYWRFRPNHQDRLIASLGAETKATLAKVTDYFDKHNLVYKLGESARDALSRQVQASQALQNATKAGELIKSGLDPESAKPFLRYVRTELPRRLRSHQEKAATFMLSVANSANFSVPGSGKTSVVLAVFAWLRQLGECGSLFVVGPRSCFVPWQHEYEATLGVRPRVCTLAGIPPEERVALYNPVTAEIADLYLCTYSTLFRDVDHVVKLFRYSSIKVFFIVDEAHYVKRPDGAWAQSALLAATAAVRRCVLTGTPFPHSYADAISLFNVSYPEVSPLSLDIADRIRVQSERQHHGDARCTLEPVIYPLYYRVRKKDLGLSEPKFLPPVSVSMNHIERRLYDTIVDRIRTLSESDAIRDAVTISKLRRGRLMRLRQVLSNSALLHTVIDEYDEDLLGHDQSVASLIANYEDTEVPGKVTVLLDLIADLRRSRDKVVVWSYFVDTLYLLREHCRDQQWLAEVVCGRTPTSPGTTGDTRDEIIERFKDARSGLDILIANPSACAESISLHRACSHAVYYDLSYNCAEYLQSLDRIHRVGGSEHKISYYHHLQYSDTFEPEILRNISEKATRMAEVLDVDFPYCYTDLPDIEEHTYKRLVQ